MATFSILEAIPILLFYSDISPFDTKYANPNEICESFKCLCKNSFSVLYAHIRSINNNFEKFKDFYCTLNSMFCVICFSENMGY